MFQKATHLWIWLTNPPKLHFVSVPRVGHLQLTHSLLATVWTSIPTTELESQISDESRVSGWRVGVI